jgi:hypothetical protein
MRQYGYLFLPSSSTIQRLGTPLPTNAAVIILICVPCTAISRKFSLGDAPVKGDTKSQYTPNPEVLTRRAARTKLPQLLGKIVNVDTERLKPRYDRDRLAPLPQLGAHRYRLQGAFSAASVPSGLRTHLT